MRERDVDADDVVEQLRRMTFFGRSSLVVCDRLALIQDLFRGCDDRDQIGESNTESVSVGDLEEEVGLCLLRQARPEINHDELVRYSSMRETSENEMDGRTECRLGCR